MITTTIYTEQYFRVQRWFKRLEEIHNGRVHNRDSHYYQDVAYAFFLNCFHLKDWLVESGAIAESEVKQFIDSNKEMGVCHALCVGSKHLIIRNPSIDSSVTIKNRNILLGLGGTIPIIAVDYVIEASGIKYSAYNLAKQCVELWDRFLNEHGLNIV